MIPVIDLLNGVFSMRVEPPYRDRPRTYFLECSFEIQRVLMDSYILIFVEDFKASYKAIG